MASHARFAKGSNGNGASNGAGGSMTQRKIEALLAHHDAAATALRTTLALLRGESIDKREHRAPDVLAAAVQIDAARRKYKTPDYQGTAAVKARRQRTADLLSTFDLHKPKSSAGMHRQFGVLIQHGYVKKVRDGYVRTAKPFIP